jgi:pimeloyl-ACP methyl ester carboxylesterase
MEAARKKRRRRSILTVVGLAGVAALGVAVGAAAFGGGPDVGYFTSAAGRETYRAAYFEAQAEGPEPSAALDIRTDWGIVRVWRFDSTTTTTTTTTTSADSTTDTGTESLLLLPGTASGSPMWSDNLASLTADRTVYTLDLLGEPGLSVQEQPLTNAEDLADWIAQVIDTLPGPQHVLGHSLGGWMAMNLAVHRPDSPASVILIDPASTFTDLPAEVIIRSIPASVPWLPQSWRDGFASWTANDAPVDDVPVAEMIEAGMQHYALAAPAPSRFTDDQLVDVDLPMLVVIAGASRMHNPADATQTAERTLSNATVHVYEGASHAITGEEPERLAHDINDFLQD